MNQRNTRGLTRLQQSGSSERRIWSSDAAVRVDVTASENMKTSRRNCVTEQAG